MGINYESTLDNRTLFWYIIIFIGLVFAFSKMKIELNIIFGFIVGCILLYFLHTDYKEKQINDNNIKSFQETLLLPKLELATEHEDVVKYLFSIQDFYAYHPQAYHELTNALENFFRIYENTYDNPKDAGQNYAMLINQKQFGMNALQSIIYKLPTNVMYTTKLEKSIMVLDELLQKYIDNIERIQKIYVYEHGYDIGTKLIDKSNVSSHDSHDNTNNLFTYELF